MSKKHVSKYYLQVEQQYLQMQQQLEEFQKYIGNGVTQEQINTVTQVTQALRSNYERITYIMYLLNLPNKKNRRVKSNINNLPDDCREEKIIDENTYVLRQLEEYIEKCKKEK